MKNKYCKQVLAVILAATMMAGTVSTATHRVYASEETQATEEGDNVVITKEEKPYLALGADLTADQQHTVLSYMGIDVADLTIMMSSMSTMMRNTNISMPMCQRSRLEQKRYHRF